MKSLLFIVSVLIIGYIGQQFLPWWSIALIAGVLSFIFSLRVGISFWVGFLAVALLWGSYAGYLNTINEGILAARMGKVFGGLNGILLVIITGILGGVFGGLGALTGSLGKQLLK
jgi:hypothetical protein